MHQPDLLAINLGQCRVTGLGSGKVGGIAFLDQRAHPIDLLVLSDDVFQIGDNIVIAFKADKSRVDRFAPGRFLRHPRHIHVSISRQRKSARNGRCRHHQHINAFALVRQGQPLLHSEAVLFINHRHAQILKFDIRLEQRMRANGEAGGSVGQSSQRITAAFSLIAANHDIPSNAQFIKIRTDGLGVLQRQYFCRCH